MNFEYSPGLFGYGIKGADGSIGLNGLGLYFTDYNPYSQSLLITNAIENNLSLLSTAKAGTVLPNGRTYINGELFIDFRGQVWVIDNTSKRYSITPMRIISGNYFVDSQAQTSNGFERFYNDPSAKYIIDNVKALEAKPDYTQYPSTIYGISVANFARIEFTDVTRLQHNAFTVYSSGELEFVDDDKSFAIIRDFANNTFRMGNLDSDDIVRTTNFSFDVSGLMKNTNLIKFDTPTGEILSNIEVSANALFTPVFDPKPNSFLATSDTATDVSIKWNLLDFTSDSCIHGEIHLIKKLPTISDMYKSCTFHDVSPNGSLKITNMTTGDVYGYYMSIVKDGWVRNSDIKEVKIGDAVKTLVITNPDGSTNYTINASANGSINGAATYNATFTTNSSYWSATPSQSWINCISASGDWTSPAFDVSVAVNKNGARTGNISLTSGPITSNITVNQESGASSLFSSPSFILFDQYGKLQPGYSNTIRVLATPDVIWASSASTPWITITNGTGTGNGSFSFSVGAGTPALGIIFVYSTNLTPDISTYVNIIRENK